MSGGSFISTNDPRPHFGLGFATDAGSAEIHWPSGTVETVKLPAVDRIYTIREGEGIAGAMCGGKPCASGVSRLTRGAEKFAYTEGRSWQGCG
jgi:enediyne biosynthesis protein E4